jgi:hypothetical protein
MSLFTLAAGDWGLTALIRRAVKRENPENPVNPVKENKMIVLSKNLVRASR